MKAQGFYNAMALDLETSRWHGDVHGNRYVCVSVQRAAWQRDVAGRHWKQWEQWKQWELWEATIGFIYLILCVFECVHIA